MLLKTAYDRTALVSEVRSILTKLTDILISHLYSDEEIANICQMRGYTDPRMIRVLSKKQIFLMPSLSDIQILAKHHNMLLTPQLMRNLGLISDKGDYFLDNRYAIPLRDYNNQVICLICWYPDKRKYITTSTLGFTSTASFFNQESICNLYAFDKAKTTVFVTEGIFDALSVESLGYCAFGNQGLDLSPLKKEMLSRFDTVYFIPDNDAPGRMSSKYSCLKSSHIWDTGYNNSKELKLMGNVKDMDDLIKKYHIQDLQFLTNTQSNLIKIGV